MQLAPFIQSCAPLKVGAIANQSVVYWFISLIRIEDEMRAFVRDMFDYALTYVIGALASFGWFVIGMYVYTRPMPPDTQLGADFNHDIGTALVAQGLIFFVTFVAGLVVRIARGKRDHEERKLEQKMIREMHQWMLEQRNLQAVSQSSFPEVNAVPEIEPLALTDNSKITSTYEVTTKDSPEAQLH